jgi:CBS-domain-containing membrane protein
MGLTKTIHPPAGATALLCSTELAIVALGWLFLPVIILGTILILAVALGIE